MFKTALFNCAINEKCCSVDGGRGIRPHFSSPPWGIWQLKSPHPRQFAIQGKKMLMPGGQLRGGGGGVPGAAWLMHNLNIFIFIFEHFQVLDSPWKSTPEGVANGKIRDSPRRRDPS